MLSGFRSSDKNEFKLKDNLFISSLFILFYRFSSLTKHHLEENLSTDTEFIPNDILRRTHQTKHFKVLNLEARAFVYVPVSVFNTVSI